MAKRLPLIVAVLVLVGAIPALLRSAPTGVQRSFKTWSQYLGGADSSQYSALDQINQSTVSQLDVVWRYPTADSRSYRFNPIVVDGTMFVLAKNNSIVALDASDRTREVVARQRRCRWRSWNQLLGEQRPIGSSASVPECRFADGHRRADRRRDSVVRRSGTRRRAHRSQSRSVEDPPAPDQQPRSHLSGSLHRVIACRRRGICRQPR